VRVYGTLVYDLVLIQATSHQMFNEMCNVE
jgi:hypothetical protein